MVVNHRESVSGHLLYKVSKKQHLEPSMHHLQHCAQSRQLQHRICPAQLCAGKQLAWAGCPLCFQGQLQGEAANSLITLLSSLPIKSLRSGKTLKSNDRSRFYKNLHVLLSLWEDVGALTNPGNKSNTQVLHKTSWWATYQWSPALPKECLQGLMSQPKGLWQQPLAGCRKQPLCIDLQQSGTAPQALTHPHGNQKSQTNRDKLVSSM